MRYFDLHCDTLYKAVTENSGFNNPKYEVSLDRGKIFDNWTQCMAIWIPDSLDCNAQTKLFFDASIKFREECNRYHLSVESANAENLLRFFLTVENGAFLNGDIRRIELLKEAKVRMITLTWNAENCIGGGADAQSSGLTSFGKECVKELEDNSIIIDISHASDRLFYDVAQIAKRPFVASHSNSRSICPHRRNLTDEQFETIKNRQGIVGLNFHRDFLSSEPQKASIKDVLCHAEHFLSLGGEDTLAIGSDFDGSNPIAELNTIEKIPILYEEFLKIGYNEQLVQKIMYYNAHNFFSRF